MIKRFHQNGAVPLLLSLVMSAGIFYACRKTQEPGTGTKPPKPKEHFFEIPEITDSTVAAIAQTVRRQDEERHLVDKLIDKAGYPLWDKARISSKDQSNEKQIFIPFVQEGKKQTRAMLIVKLKDKDTSFSLLYNSNAAYFPFKSTKPGSWNAKDIFHAFLAFDNAIFGHTKFTVRNGRFVDDTTGSSHTIEILPLNAQIPGSSNNGANRQQDLYPVTTWVTFITCGLCAFKETQVNSVERCCNATYNTVPVTYWFNDANDETTYDLPAGYSENGGAMICPGCSWEDTNPCDVTPPYTQVCDADWQPTLHIPTNNPFDYDTIHVESGLETVFPCIASFIRDSLTNPNLLAQIAGANIFHDSLKVNLSFDTAYQYTSDTSVYTGYTKSNGIFVSPGGETTFRATVYLNPWFLRNGSKEFNISNILHEIMHAAFTLRWAQYQNWLQNHDTPYDSNFIKARFPMYWYATNYGTSPFTPEQDHEIMASDYLEQFKSIMTKFYNPNASTAIRDTVIKALAYHGLHKTTAWKALPSQGIDTCKYKGMEVSAEKASNFQTPTGCSSTYTYWYSRDLKLRSHCQ
jgi:hypothetical protein